ncbi:AAA family ATPase [Micromonospora sp. WMMD1102]|uniref:helix-turn-helix transcriptional regulator n=1 Tax=Micromonospora sp. WMMD1102 TaxID=3016105 RepID=UPI0024158FA8|nr:LuxR family transcriptional regulator [Micromonospora sp. WMMD1102]MDG4786493.1 AAA family ATPase [Micromonospora sp. WMMD1102]
MPVRSPSEPTAAARSGRPQTGAAALVGRDAELARMAALLDSDRSRPRFLVLQGEPGIGKSRLVAEFARVAGERGRTVLLGRATEFERSLPYGVLLDALAGVPDHRADLHALLDSLPVPDPGGPGPATAAVERHRRHRRLRGLVTAAARPGGALLVCDDVQWADDASVEFLGYLLRHPPDARMTVVLAFRSEQCPPRLAEELAHLAPLPDRLRLAPLTGADLDRLLPAEPASRRRLLYQVSGGNPLYLELLAGTSTQVLGALRRGDFPDEPVTDALHGAMAAEVRGLGPTERLVLQATAVVGPGLDIGTVAAAAGLDPQRTTIALDALVVRDLLRQVGAELDFRHSLVRAVAYWLAGPAWRLAAHRRAAAHLERTGAPLTLRAHHLGKAIRPGDEAAAEVLATAATTTMGTAPSTSAGWLRVALAALPDGPGRADRRAELRLLFAKALGVTGQFDEARTVLHDLVAVAGPHRHAAVEQLAVLERLAGRLDVANALLSTELDRLGATGTPQAMLRLELAVTEMLAGRWRTGSRHARRTMDRARQDGHQGIEAAASTVLAACAVAREPLPTARLRVSYAARLIDALGDAALRDELGAIALLAWIETMLDRVTDGLAHAERGIEVGLRYGRIHVHPLLYAARSVLYGTVGRVDDALRDAEEAEEIARWQGGAEAATLAAAVRLRPLLWLAGPDAVRPVLERLRGGAAARSTLYRAVARMHLAEAGAAVGDDTGCPELLADAETYRCLGPAEANVLVVRALTAATPGRPEPVGGGPVGGGPAVDGPVAAIPAGGGSAGIPASARRWLARAAGAAGDLPGRLGLVGTAGATLALAHGAPGDAVARVTPAVEQLGAAGMPVAEGQARMVLAEALAATGDPQSAREQLGRAKQLFATSGARWLAGQADRAQRRLAARLSRPAGPAAGADAATEPAHPLTLLTAREREVAELTVTGATSRVIARQLQISPRTVDAHLMRIYRKLGVTSRTALVGLLARG